MTRNSSHKRDITNENTTMRLVGDGNREAVMTAAPKGVKTNMGKEKGIPRPVIFKSLKRLSRKLIRCVITKLK